MAEIDAVVMKNVRLFLEKLCSEGIVISEAYIFGSYANGKADKWSDIDIAIVSPQISEDRFEERVKLTKLAISVDDRLEPLPFNQDSFNDEDPFVQKIKNEGLVVN
ncbi:MAG: nucleotidyltransferase domain-containing protein [Thermodesulfobacteriota bacterium]|nr:nucleotidyltransferase domain-containing protein [Thermodesulfobacteriota bacterium]